MFTSLRNRLSIYFISLSVIPLLVVGLIMAYVIFNELEQTAVRDQGLIAEGIAQRIEDYINERVNDLNNLILVNGLASMPVTQQEDTLDNLLDYTEAFSEIALVGADGMETVKVNSRASYPLGTRTDSDAFEVPLNTGESYVGLARYDVTIREPVITMSVPIMDRTGMPSQVLMANFRVVAAADVLEGLEIGTGQSAYVTSIDGRILVHTDETVDTNTLAEFPVENGRATGLLGDAVILATHSIMLGDGNQIVVAVEQPVSIVNALGSDVMTVITGAILLTLVVAVLVVIASVRQVVRPVENLSAVAEAIYRGDIDRKADDSRPDEIGQLGRTFNAMTARLNDILGQQQESIEQLTDAERENKRLIRELKEALIFKDQFLATMSHELRTPLNAIQGYTGIALMQKDVPASEKHMLERIKVNAKRLLTLINDILDISRINAGRIELVNETFDIRELVQGWYDDHLARVGDARLDFAFTLEYDENLPSTTIGDTERISQIANNLLVNAFKFTEEGEIKLTTRREGDHWQIIVSDTGSGIPETWHHLIFDEFRQVDSSSRRKHGGSGLGLSIVKKLVLLMDGQVTVSSKPGAGSIFTVTLPLHEIDQQPYPKVPVAFNAAG